MILNWEYWDFLLFRLTVIEDRKWDPDIYFWTYVQNYCKVPVGTSYKFGKDWNGSGTVCTLFSHSGTYILRAFVKLSSGNIFCILYKEIIFTVAPLSSSLVGYPQLLQEISACIPLCCLPTPTCHFLMLHFLQTASFNLNRPKGYVTGHLQPPL